MDFGLLKIKKNVRVLSGSSLDIFDGLLPKSGLPPSLLNHHDFTAKVFWQNRRFL
jgi:hypothetical protein